VTKHLGVLEDAGLVTRERVGREVRFAVEPGRLQDAVRTMAEIAHAWDRRLAAIKRLAEATHRRTRDEPGHRA
jgi:DNA-binding transcriptional ArsR family regulator